MAWSREPYPAKEKWTIEQERAYAERRKPAIRSSRTKTVGGKRKRIVRTAAGARRYKVPIGSEIGTARNAEAAKSQRDTESTNRYRSLVGGNQGAQRAALRGLHNGALQRLSRVAYSFKSSDPNVVRLRIGVANELRRRGMNVNDYGGLGPKTKNPGPAGTWARDQRRKKAAKAKRKPVRRTATKKAPAPVRKPKPKIKPARSVMSARSNDRRLRELSVPQLRAAMKVFGRIPAGKRQAVARVLVRQAIELAAPHFLSESVIEAANLPDQTRTKVIELAGRWRHGWIPLDAAAINAKTKGRGGKPWWGAPKGGGGSSKGRMSGSLKTRTPVSSKQAPQFAAKKRGSSPDRIPAVPGESEWRRKKNGNYTLYVNGKPSKARDQSDVSLEQARKLSASMSRTLQADKSQSGTSSKVSLKKPDKTFDFPKKASAGKGTVGRADAKDRASAGRSPAHRNRLTPEQIAKRAQFNRTPTGGLPEVKRKPGKA